MKKSNLYGKKPKSSTSWGHESVWYDELLKSSDTFQEKVILPNLIRCMNIKNTDRILDVACGQGYFSLAMFGKCQEVLGVDVGEDLIEQAKVNAKLKRSNSTTQDDKSGQVNFLIADATKLGVLSDQFFDKVMLILAIQNIDSVQQTLVGIAKNLKPGGKLYLVLNHPAFRVPKFSSWNYDFKSKAQYRRVDRYLSELRVSIDMHPGAHNKSHTFSFHRPLQFYVQKLAAAGFAVTNLEEWISHKKSDSGPMATGENVARQEIPMFLFLEATKL